jgi:carbon monoxide dehydrogenase subunit G
LFRLEAPGLLPLATVRSMLRAKRTLVTATPPVEVFSFLADFRNAERWDPGTVTCELVEGDTGAGSVYRNVSSFFGRSMEITYTTVEREEGRRVHFRGHNDGFTGLDRLAMSASGAGTEVTYDVEYQFHGIARLAYPLAAAYLPFLARKTMQQLGATLDRLGH